MGVHKPDHDGIDPLWIKMEGRTALLLHLAEETSPIIAVGGFICDACTDTHVMIAVAFADQQIDFHTDAAGAREFAAALMETANRLDPKGGMN